MTVCVQALLKYPLEITFAFFRALLYLKDGKEKHYYDGLSVLCQSMLRSFGYDQNRRALGHCVFWSLLGTIPLQFLYSKELQALRKDNILQTKQTTVLQTLFHVLEMIYNGVINKGVCCDCLGK